ncbi:MAG: hypothetical protein ACTHJH_00945 [Marmoricola sp.]
MRLDWLSPLVWVPATLFLCSALAWMLIGMTSVSDGSGALCGTALHWYSKSATTTGGEVSPSQRAEQDEACHEDAVTRVHAADQTLAVGVGVAGLSAASLALRRRRSAPGN